MLGLYRNLKKRSGKMLRVIPKKVSRAQASLLLVISVVIVSQWIGMSAHAAIAYRSATSANNGTGSTTLAINTPTNSGVGDVLIASVIARGPAEGIIASGWTHIQSRGVSGTYIMSTYYRVLSEAPPASYSFTFQDGLINSVSTKAAGGIISYSGVDTANPIDTSASQANASGTTSTAPSITTSVSNAMIVATYGTATGTTATQGSSMTERFDDASTGGNAGTRSTSSGQDAIQAAAGATGTKIMTFGAAAVNAGTIVALRPAPPATITQTAYRWFSNVNAGNFSTVTNNPTTAADAVYAATNDSSFIYTTGYVGTNGNGWRIEKRQLTDGALVTGFGTNGIVDPTISANDDRAWGIDQDASYIYVAGQDATVSNTNIQWRIEKRDKTTGALVNGFGTSGVVQSNPTAGIDTPKEVKVDDSFIYIAGGDNTGAGAWRIEKRDKTTGALVNGFGTNGAIVTDFVATENEQIAAMVLDTDNIYVGGYDYSSGSTLNSQSRIEKRDKTTGALVSGFGANGAVIENPFTGNSSSTVDDAVVHKGLVINGGNLYVAGSQGVTGSTDFQWRITKRDLTTGALVNGFGTNGVVNVNPSTAIDNPTTIRTDGTSLFVAGFDRTLDAGFSQWRIEKRDMTSGALVSGFGTNGVATTNPSTNHDELRDLIISGDNIYPVGYDFSPGNYQWRIEKRNKLTGSGPADHGVARAAQDTSATSVAINEQVRLRLLLKVGTSPLSAADQQFKLQFAQQSGTCDVGFNGESYTDVTATSAIAFHDNTALTDATAAYFNLSDPTDGANPVATQSYEEANNFTNTATVVVGSNGLWDISLYNRSAPNDSTYCFRVVDSSGALLSAYTSMPTLSTPITTTLGQANYRWFANADSITPGSPLASQDTAATSAPDTNVRLRQRIAVDAAQLTAASTAFKLQYAEKSGTCDVSFNGEAYTDISTNQSQTVISVRAVSDPSNGGTAAWAQLDNLTQSDGVFGFASSNSGGLSELLTTDFYGFGIPTNATIKGIEVFGDRYYGGVTPSASEQYIGLLKEGVVGSSSNLSTGASWESASGSWGGPNELWGTTWTPAEINSDFFGVAVAVSISADGGATNAYLDSLETTVYYTTGASLIDFYNNASVASGAAISSVGSDPTNGGRPVAYQTYQEVDPFANAATVPTGSDALWDVSLNISSAASGKTYCIRMVESSGALLDTYSQIPEITITAASGGPTLDQQLRGGQSVIGGQKTPINF